MPCVGIIHYSPLVTRSFDVCVQIFPPYAVLSNHCTLSSAYTRYMHCLAGCMYDPVIPVHCTARVSLWQPLWSVPLAPVRAYDRCTEGWTDTGSENEPSFKRKRLSLQNRARNPSRNPRASRGGPVILRRAN